MPIVSVSNQKGGVGKTTTAINLAVYLTHKGYKVLFLDLDPQANATSGLGVDPSHISEAGGVYEALIAGEVQGQIITSPDCSIDIIPATPDLSGAEVELVAMLGRESRLKEMLEPIEASYDYIFIDTPPTLGLLTVNALTASDVVLVPLQCEYYALEGLAQLLSTIQIIRRRLNQTLKLGGVILTMYDKRNKITSQVAAEVHKHFSEDTVFTQVIPRNVKLAEAPSFGKPILFYDPSCPGALAYQALAEEFRTRIPALSGSAHSQVTEQDPMLGESHHA